VNFRHFVGARGGAETSFPHHNARFDIDERSLDVGYQMMVGLGLGNDVLRRLSNDGGSTDALM